MTTIARSLCLGAVSLAAAIPSSAEPVFSSPNVDGEISADINLGYDFTPDGRYILFTAQGDDMAAGDTNQTVDLIIRDRMTNANELITPSSSLGGHMQTEGEYRGAMSADGRYVVFESRYNFVSGLAEDFPQIYVRDRTLQQTFRVSNTDAGEPLEASSGFPAISDDGRYVAFISYAESIAEGEGVPRTYLVDRVTGERRMLSRNRGGDPLGTVGNAPPVSMSGDGRWIVFATQPLLPEAGQLVHVYLYDRDDDSLRIVSRTPSGDVGNGHSGSGVISRDGRYIAFESTAPNLTGRPADDAQALRVDRISGAIDKVDVDRQGNQVTTESTGDSPRVLGMSSDGRFVAFFVAKKLFSGGGCCAFVRDMDEHHTVAANVDRDGRAVAVNRFGPVSDDGRLVLMHGARRMYGPGLSVPESKQFIDFGDVFLQDLSPVDIEIRLVASTERGRVNAVIENHSSKQASFAGLRITSSPPVLLDDADPGLCRKQLLPSECQSIFVPAGQQTTVGLVFLVKNVASAVDVEVTLDPNEPDPNMTNNSARISFEELSPPPPPPSNSGGGGAFGWMGAALLSLLLWRRSTARTRFR